MYVHCALGFERLPIPDETYHRVLASHVLEHVPWFHTQAALPDVRRILKPGGLFEVWVPDFGKITEAYASGTILDDWLPLNPERDPWKCPTAVCSGALARAKLARNSISTAPASTNRA